MLIHVADQLTKPLNFELQTPNVKITFLHFYSRDVNERNIHEPLQFRKKLMMMIHAAT